jgi:hypothetical protein
MPSNSRSNDNGRAFEYACLYALKNALQSKTSHYPEVDEGYSPHIAAYNAWMRTDENLRAKLDRAARTAAEYLFKLEPMLDENGDDPIRLIIQPDGMGERGDVRDIIVMRSQKEWSIGLSLKHNHFAVKHSRIASDLDFGSKWYSRSCSNEYWETVNPIFNRLVELKEQRFRWSSFTRDDKWDNVYVPLLNAFKDEIIRQADKYYDLPRRMVEYLLGQFDFYKVIGQDSKRVTRFQVFNFRDTLNKSSSDRDPDIKITKANLPRKILHFDFKANSKTTLIMCLDNGWQFSFRIHNGDGPVIPSLKFDIQIIGMPTDIKIIDVDWID